MVRRDAAESGLLCRSGRACKNPLDEKRPTRLRGQASALRGYCSYCVEAGVHSNSLAQITGTDKKLAPTKDAAYRADADATTNAASPASPSPPAGLDLTAALRDAVPVPTSPKVSLIADTLRQLSRPVALGGESGRVEAGRGGGLSFTQPTSREAQAAQESRKDSSQDALKDSLKDASTEETS